MCSFEKYLKTRQQVWELLRFFSGSLTSSYWRNNFFLILTRGHLHLLFLEKRREERKTSVWEKHRLIASAAPSPGPVRGPGILCGDRGSCVSGPGMNPQPGMRPAWESHPQPLGYGMMLQPLRHTGQGSNRLTLKKKKTKTKNPISCQMRLLALSFQP